VTHMNPDTGKNTEKAGPEDDSGSARERVVIKDKRKIDANGQPKTADSQGGAEAPAEATMGQPADDVISGELMAESAESAPASVGEGPFDAELEAIRNERDERVRDLQRLQAEYLNYRKRVDRDRDLIREQASAGVIVALLPILDDLDRAREHDDLVGPAAAMAEQLSAVLSKFGLNGFGEVGDAFDPTRHEAVSHATSAEVTEPTCVSVMRRGYLLGDRLLRAALVGVADPE
jgi:molecular chaperone GrpE